jgi:hypothetical protein
MLFARKMDRTGDYHVKWNKADWERHITCSLSPEIYTPKTKKDRKEMTWVLNRGTAIQKYHNETPFTINIC